MAARAINRNKLLMTSSAILIGFTDAYAQSLSADCDLDLDLATCFTLMTYLLVSMIICAKLFSNPTMQDEVMGLAGLEHTNTDGQGKL